MKQVDFAKNFTLAMEYSFPGVNVKRAGDVVVVSTPRSTITISSLRDVVTFKRTYNGKLDTYTTDWNKHFKPNMVSLSAGKVAELLELGTIGVDVML